VAAKEGMISLRVKKEDLESWEEAARYEGVSRSTWIRLVLNRAATVPPQAKTESPASSGVSASVAEALAGYQE
jgi:hypothetical protein